MDVEQIAGSFVVEIGIRQAWPFLGLCDNRPTPNQETRLYIDASWAIEAADSAGGSADDGIRWLTAATVLNGRTIDAARVNDDGSLRLTADPGIALVVSGEPEPYTVGEPWRLSEWHPA
ncbi:hypothetical protein [Actinoplanes subtropicus]|uniref:hypothetical protein n=1 Tax=Actinoplanes subtropicus TaxID=543632 RepID=UPI0004C3AFD6|nr:hypothetical protein [Actinoplanes subtropicus]